jgi:AcrR family transcriptional regulator
MGRDSKTGRRRRARGSLSREEIIAAAVALADREGLDGLSMPRLARALNCGVMSLYGHVRNKQDLLEAVGGSVLAGITVPEGAADDWQGRVVGFMLGLRQALLAHPSLAGLLARQGLGHPSVFAHLEQCLGILRAAGFGPEAAARAFYALLTYTLGFVVWEAARNVPGANGHDDGGYAGAWQMLVDGLPASRFPVVHALREPLATVASEAQYEFGLAALQRGLQSAP